MIRHSKVALRLGLDIASLAESDVVNQIVMISGDSDFVPAAKLARRAGIDFLLDPMWSEQISDSLSEHIDGTRQCVLRPPLSLNDPLHVCHPSFNLGEDSEDIEI
ncbi:NYN domain-containing protein [Arcanobacterium haemolyticum]|uniref:NYN domain-containing protein n=1 Tax=Arcanobacterium haemolyticum TaxID=28264 RepID=UPI001E2BADA4|nr:NYN domain-containing protein [Arcanobacterium haemolyticum]